MARVVRTDDSALQTGIPGCSRHPPGTPRVRGVQARTDRRTYRDRRFRRDLYRDRCSIVDATSTKQTRQPSHQSVSNPLTRVSGTLSTQSPGTCRDASTPWTTTLFATSPINRKRPCSAVLDPPSWTISDRGQGFADSAPRVVSDFHCRGLERRRGETGVAVGSGGCPLLWVDAVHQEVTQRTLSAECQEPFGRVSGTLSEPVSRTHRRLIRDISKMPLTRENTKNGNEMTSE